jgi:four helix bundle protein
MATEPPPFVKFREPQPQASEQGEQQRVEVYQQALDLAARIFTVIELAEVERFYLRDQLDRRSTVIALYIAQGLATPDMVERRRLYQHARMAVTDCTAVLDILSQRGTVEPEAISAARTLAVAMLDKLQILIIPPPIVR